MSWNSGRCRTPGRRGKDPAGGGLAAGAGDVGRGSGTGGEGAFRASDAQGRPGEVEERLLRTFQRRVRDWRLAERAGARRCFSPRTTRRARCWRWIGRTWAALGITIEGRALKHKLFHAVLPYSNWEWAVRAHSESTLSLRGGLEGGAGAAGPGAAGVALGSFLDGDPSVEAGRRGARVQRGVSGHLRAFRHRAAHDQRGQAAGKRFDCESSHGHLKRRIKQHLLHAREPDFASEEEYDAVFGRGVGGGQPAHGRSVWARSWRR